MKHIRRRPAFDRQTDNPVVFLRNVLENWPAFCYVNYSLANAIAAMLDLHEMVNTSAEMAFDELQFARLKIERLTNEVNELHAANTRLLETLICEEFKR